MVREYRCRDIKIEKFVFVVVDMFKVRLSFWFRNFLVGGFKIIKSILFVFSMVFFEDVFIYGKWYGIFLYFKVFEKLLIIENYNC